MRFAAHRHDVRIQVLVATFDDADAPFAATWRAVGEAAEELGLTRPSYHLVRALARVDRLRRSARTEVRQAAVGTLLALTSPLAIDVRIAAEKLKEARGRERLVLQQHKPPPRARPP
jgi:hypothetical protein